MKKLPQETRENKLQRELVQATWVIAIATVLLVIVAILALL